MYELSIMSVEKGIKLGGGGEADDAVDILKD